MSIKLELTDLGPAQVRDETIPLPGTSEPGSNFSPGICPKDRSSLSGLKFWTRPSYIRAGLPKPWFRG